MWRAEFEELMYTKYEEIFEKNRRWVAQTTADDPTFFKRLAEAQSPDFLFIGCSDSRVPANVIMGMNSGEVFVHRNVANLVPNSDMNVKSVIQYAVEHLHVHHIIVCGHYGCGGIKSAMEQKDLGQLNGWLGEIRDIYRLHYDELTAIEDEEARYRRLVEINVQEQAINVRKTSWVQQHVREYGFPHIHGWCYALEDGVLHDLAIPCGRSLNPVYQIS